MADIKITDLQLRGSVTSGLNFPSDDGIQTYRVTAAQIRSFMMPILRADLQVGAIGRGTVVSIANADSPYTQLEDTDFIFVNGTSGVTITPLSASGRSGKMVWIKKTDSTFGVVTITGVTALHTEGEAVLLMSDGSSWNVIDRRIPSALASFTPTGSWSTNTTYTGFWKRVADSIFMDIKIALAGAPTSATLTVNMPFSLELATTKMVENSDGGNAFVSNGIIWDSPTRSHQTRFGTVNSATAIYIQSNATTGWQAITQSAPITFANGDFITCQGFLPVKDWNG